MATPYALFLFDEVSSTQDEAFRHAGRQPALVVAARQTGGRGRLGRPWRSAPRALAASLAVQPEWSTEALPRVSLMSAMAARRALGGRVACKWPNDLLLAGEKVAGLLLEMTEGLLVVGLGVNVWWPDRPAGVGALYAQDPGPGAHVEIAERWARDLLDRLEKGPDDWGRQEYLGACRTIGRRIRWQPGGEGWARDVDDVGRLVVETPSGFVRLSSGEVWEVR